MGISLLTSGARWVNFSHINTPRVKNYSANPHRSIQTFIQLQVIVDSIAQLQPGNLWVKTRWCPSLQTITPYVDVLYKFTINPLRTEVQYMKTDQDYGSALFACFNSALPQLIFRSIRYVQHRSQKDPGRQWYGTQKKYFILLLAPFTSKVLTVSTPLSNKWKVFCSGGICRPRNRFPVVYVSL